MVEVGSNRGDGQVSPCLSHPMLSLTIATHPRLPLHTRSTRVDPTATEGPTTTTTTITTTTLSLRTCLHLPCIRTISITPSFTLTVGGQQ